MNLYRAIYNQRGLTSLITGLLLGILTIATAADNTTAHYDLQGSVVKIKDGDSLVLNSNGRQYEVRLHGIDAPEWRQPHGEPARAALKRLVLYREVQVQRLDTDSYGRVVGRVYRDGIDISVAMVRSGDAWWYRRYVPRDQALEEAESHARSNRLGLWRTSAPVPPWQWRH